MYTPRFTAEELNRLRELAFGDDGPGLDVDFRTVEQTATTAACGLTEGTLQQMLHQQTQKVPEHAPPS